MKKIFQTLLLLIFAPILKAAEPWKLHLESQEEKMTLKIDLYEESVNVPGMEMFGPMNGYLGGKGVYGVWMITSFEIESEKKAVLRLSNDQGSETQSVKLTQQSDSTYLMDLQGGVVVKRVSNHKLVKVPSNIVLKIKS